MARFNFKATLRGIAELLSNNVNFKQPPTLYLQGTYNIAVAPGDTVYIALFSSGGGGGCSTYTPNYADLKGGDGGGGAYVKVAYTNNGLSTVNLTLTVGHTGWGNTNGSHYGGNAEPAFAIVNY